MLAFGFLLALAVILVRGAPVDVEDARRVVFTEADVAQVRARHVRTWTRPPTAVELRKAFERHVREEVLYREALARGLDRGDPTVRMVMVRKITMLGTARADAAELTDEDLQAYFALRRERYRIPAMVSLMQVPLSRDKRGDRTRADAEELLAALRQGDPRPEDLAGLGDVLMLPSVCADMAERDLDRTFGGDFSAAVTGLTPGQWEGPVESGFGLHLVKVTRREESRIPDWSEVRGRIETDMRYDARKAAEDQFYAEVAPRYQLLYDEGAAAVLEGRTP
jgi:hypothetical protein